MDRWRWSRSISHCWYSLPAGPGRPAGARRGICASAVRRVLLACMDDIANATCRCSAARRSIDLAIRGYPSWPPARNGEARHGPDQIRHLERVTNPLSLSAPLNSKEISPSKAALERPRDATADDTIGVSSGAWASPSTHSALPARAWGWSAWREPATATRMRRQTVPSCCAIGSCRAAARSEASRRWSRGDYW